MPSGSRLRYLTAVVAMTLVLAAAFPHACPLAGGRVAAATSPAHCGGQPPSSDSPSGRAPHGDALCAMACAAVVVASDPSPDLAIQPSAWSQAAVERAALPRAPQPLDHVPLTDLLV